MPAWEVNRSSNRFSSWFYLLCTPPLSHQVDTLLPFGLRLLCSDGRDGRVDANSGYGGAGDQRPDWDHSEHSGHTTPEKTFLLRTPEVILHDTNGSSDWTLPYKKRLERNEEKKNPSRDCSWTVTDSFLCTLPFLPLSSRLRFVRTQSTQ